MKKFIFSVIALMMIISIVSAGPSVSTTLNAKGGSLMYSSSTLTQTGTNIAHFGPVSNAYNEQTESYFALTDDTTQSSHSSEISAISSNKLTSSHDVTTEGMLNSEIGASMMVAGSINSTGCDAGNLGIDSNNQNGAASISTTYPVTESVLSKKNIMASNRPLGKNLTTFNTDTAIVGDNFGLHAVGEFAQGSMGGSFAFSETKSFDKTSTANYNSQKDVSFLQLSDDNITTQVISDDAITGMSSAFDSVLKNSTTNITSTQITNKIISSNSTNNSTV